LSLKGRDFLSLGDYTVEELWQILNEALRLEKLGNKSPRVLDGKFLVMIFQKPSTRTRVSFEVAVKQLGGNVMCLGWNEMQLSRGETIPDTARSLECYVDGIVARVTEHDHLLELAEYANIPVINALSDVHHPCQALSDILTIYKLRGSLEALKLAWIGDGNNVCNSLLLACSKFGINMSVACPPGHEPKEEAVKMAKMEAVKTGLKIEITSEPLIAVRKADIIYTDTFISMGREAEREKRLQTFLPKYQVTPKLFEYANEGCVFMHCLPAHRGEEVVDEVIDGPRSIVWSQAENRLHPQKALLSKLI